jgi:hypothetical protein
MSDEAFLWKKKTPTSGKLNIITILYKTKVFRETIIGKQTSEKGPIRQN